MRRGEVSPGAGRLITLRRQHDRVRLLAELYLQETFKPLVHISPGARCVSDARHPVVLLCNSLLSLAAYLMPCTH